MKRRYTDEELINKTFSYLTLKEPIRKAYYGKTRIFWKCECICGNYVERREATIIDGKTESCGCMHPNKHNKASKSKQWRGCGELGSQHFNSIKSRAEKHGLEFSVTIEEAWQLFLLQNRQCALTGLPIEFNGLRQQRAGFEQTASLDRIDSSLGYIAGNVQWVHKDVNLMKNNFSQDRYVEICKLVVQQLNRQNNLESSTNNSLM